MICFQVLDMICGHSAGEVTRAVMALDNHATVLTDLARRRVEKETARPTASAVACEFKDAIARAGYSPVRQWRPLPDLTSAPRRLRVLSAFAE